MSLDRKITNHAPIWIRPADARQMFGISRPKIYELQKRGKIRSVSLAEKGQDRATRLISVASIREYLDSLDSLSSVSE